MVETTSARTEHQSGSATLRDGAPGAGWIWPGLGRASIVRGIALLTIVAAASGCQTTGYYSQAVGGHLQVLRQSTAIDKVLEDPSTPDGLKNQLRLVLRLRSFARDCLQLEANGHYLKYADLGRRHVVWNVYAAPEFSLEPRTWWYPVAGRMEYRGYFSEKRAHRYAGKLREQGNDVFVAGVQAYSTLGWFRDPVLNTFIHDDEIDLADLLFHELAHQRVFLPGDTDFNEAFATAVAEEGVRRWLRSQGKIVELEQFEADQRRRNEFVNLVSNARGKLGTMYQRAGTASNGGKSIDPEAASALRREKEAILERLRGEYSSLKTTWGGYDGYDNWFRKPLNNARLNDIDTYYALVPGFHRLLQAEDGDLSRFYERVESMKKLDREERRRSLNEPLAAH